MHSSQTPDEALTLEGMCLHTGGYSRLTLSRSLGPIEVEQDGRVVPLDRLRIARSDSGVALTDEAASLHIDLAEHLLAALGGTGVRDGVRIRLEGRELPLLDGGARCFVDALLRLGLAPIDGCQPASGPRLVIIRQADLQSGDSRYRFRPGDSVDLAVEIRFDHPLLRSQRARWSGGLPDFVERIAPARTFGFVRDAGQLFARGRARAFQLGLCGTGLSEDIASSVLVYDEVDVSRWSARPSMPDEPARHKLLDLVGDLYLYGGPPRGSIEAICPGHTATHDVVRRALSDGILELRGPARR